MGTSFDYQIDLTDAPRDLTPRELSRSVLRQTMPRKPARVTPQVKALAGMAPLGSVASDPIDLTGEPPAPKRFDHGPDCQCQRQMGSYCTYYTRD